MHIFNRDNMNHGYYHPQQPSANSMHFLAVANTNSSSGAGAGDHNNTGQTVYPVQYVDNVNRATPSQEQIVYANGQNSM